MGVDKNEKNKDREMLKDVLISKDMQYVTFYNNANEKFEFQMDLQNQARSQEVIEDAKRLKIKKDEEKNKKKLNDKDKNQQNDQDKNRQNIQNKQ